MVDVLDLKPIVICGLSMDIQVLCSPFPEARVALEWDFLKRMYEEENTLERVEELFNEHRELLNRKVLEWRTGLEAQLVKIYRTGSEGVSNPLDESDGIVTVSVSGYSSISD
jgi:hypothetical protein